jgi:hypothetical protein
VRSFSSVLDACLRAAKPDFYAFDRTGALLPSFLFDQISNLSIDDQTHTIEFVQRGYG